MKKFLFMLLLASSAQAQIVRATETQILTRALPTVASFTVTSGSTIGASLDLRDVIGFRVEVCGEVASSRTLSGAGALNAYLLNEDDGKVKRNPGLDLPISVTSTSCAGAACACQVFPDQKVSASQLGGRLIYAANAITVSGGTTVLVRITGWKAVR